MNDLIKRIQQSWCPHCKAEAGPDCIDVSMSRRTAAKKVRKFWKQVLRERGNYHYDHR